MHTPKKDAKPHNAGGQYDSLMQMASLVGNSAMEAYLREQQAPQPNALAHDSGGQELPPYLRERMEARTGISLDDVRVHYNSNKPASFMARAFAKGSNIHIAPGQEDTLEHELGHVAQQKAGLVRPTGSINGEAVNEDKGLEQEADERTVTKNDFHIGSNHGEVVQLCYLCGAPGCLRGEICGLPTGANNILARSAALAGAPGGIGAARARVAAFVAGSPDFGFGGFSFHAHQPAGNRFGFDPAIRTSLFAAPPVDAGGWIHCPYCGYEYPPARMQIDHIIPWREYAMLLTGAPAPAALGPLPAADVFVACNDPSNLVLACDHCNAAKNNTPVTAAWLIALRALADTTGGF